MRRYERQGLIVVWEPEKCIHCENCITGLPQVFDIKARPWVNINGASVEEIEEQVSKCPSAALSLDSQGETL